MPTTRRLVDMDGPDFYPTPAWATKALLYYEQFEGAIYEPFAGENDMANVIQAHNKRFDVRCSDLHDYGTGAKVCDFRKLKGRFGNVVSNPPFNLATEAVEFFLPKTNNKLCFLLRLAFLESQDRYKRIFQHGTLSRVWVFTERLSLYPKGERKGKAGGTVAYAWFVWDKVRPPGHITRLRFIKPGFKT